MFLIILTILDLDFEKLRSADTLRFIVTVSAILYLLEIEGHCLRLWLNYKTDYADKLQKKTTERQRKLSAIGAQCGWVLRAA